MPLTEQNLQLLPTTAVLQRLLAGEERGLTEVIEAAEKLAEEKRFFHWELEFPEVFEEGGFDCILGNPPWERIKLQEKEFFASRDPEIAKAKNSSERKKLIQKLTETNPILAEEWEQAKHFSDAETKFTKESGRYPLFGKKEINTYTVLTETSWQIINSKGSVGIIVPSGIATDESSQFFIQALVEKHALKSFYDFTNRGYIFKSLESTSSFCLLTISNSYQKLSKLASQLWAVKDLSNTTRVYSLNIEDIKQINPNTKNLPILNTAYDAKFINKIYKNISILEDKNTNNTPWGVLFTGMFHMSNDSGKFITSSQIQTLNQDTIFPLYESKYINIFNHRAATFEGIPEEKKYGTRAPTNLANESQLADPEWLITPRYWINKEQIENKTPGFWKYQWFMGFRNAISAVADSRSARLAIIPKSGVGNSMPLIFSDQPIKKLCALAANFNAIIFDYVVKQKASGGNLNYYIVRQLPVIPPENYTQKDIDYISSRVLELVYTAWDMKPFAEDMGYEGEPFIWDEQRRAKIRAELDAYYAKLYGLTRDELRYILDPKDVYGEDFPSETFRVLKNNEIKKYGEYRTQRLVLAAFDLL